MKPASLMCSTNTFLAEVFGLREKHYLVVEQIPGIEREVFSAASAVKGKMRACGIRAGWTTLLLMGNGSFDLKDKPHF